MISALLRSESVAVLFKGRGATLVSVPHDPSASVAAMAAPTRVSCLTGRNPMVARGHIPPTIRLEGILA